MPGSMIQRKAKVGDEWQLAGSNRGYESDREKVRPLQSLTP
jgi:hypothetical protein